MSSYHPISLKRAMRLVNLLIESQQKEKWGVMIRGHHGIGKSEIVKSLSKRLGLPLLDMRAAQMTEGDVLGIPDKESERRYCTFLPPKWFWQACEEPCLLFLDEIDRATLEVSQSFFQLTDSKGIHGRYLHPGTLIFSATNSGEYGTKYQVNDLDPASLDRWTVIDLSPTVEEWLHWAQNEGVSDYICDFIRKYPDNIEHLGQQDPGIVYPSRRSWRRLDNALRGCGAYDKLDKITSQKDLEEQSTRSLLLDIYDLAYSFVGLESAINIESFLSKEYEFEIDVFEMIENVDKFTQKIQKLHIDEQTMLINKLDEKKWFARKFKENSKDVVELTKLFRLVPKELAVMIIRKLVDNIKDNGEKFAPCYYNMRWFWDYDPTGTGEDTNGEYYCRCRGFEIDFKDYLNIDLSKFEFYSIEPEDSMEFETEWIFGEYEILVKDQITAKQARARKMIAEEERKIKEMQEQEETGKNKGEDDVQAVA